MEQPDVARQVRLDIPLRTADGRKQRTHADIVPHPDENNNRPGDKPLANAAVGWALPTAAGTATAATAAGNEISPWSSGSLGLTGTGR